MSEVFVSFDGQPNNAAGYLPSAIYGFQICREFVAVYSLRLAGVGIYIGSSRLQSLVLFDTV